MHVSSTYLRLILANGAVFCRKLANLSWNFVTAMRKCPKTTGHWPVHDIKSFAIGAVLSSLLLKEQMMISDKKKKPVWENTKSEQDRNLKASGGFEHKITGFIKVVIAQANAYHFLPPKNGQNCHLVLLKTFMKSSQNQSLSSEICPENFHEIGFF